jgi:hypothetical protein
MREVVIPKIPVFSFRQNYQVGILIKKGRQSQNQKLILLDIHGG